jgi:hypothetical protein
MFRNWRYPTLTGAPAERLERHCTAVELLQAAGMMDDGEASFPDACGNSGG